MRTSLGKERFVLAGCITASLMAAWVPSAVFADTTTYTYDALGRLVTASVSGGPTSGKTTSTSYDEAGNRKAHAIGTNLPAPTNAATFSISGPAQSASEGGFATFTVTKTGTASSNLSVKYASVNGTASAPADFDAASGTLTFRHWETVKTIAIPIKDDGMAESQEAFSVSLNTPSSGSVIGTGSATAQIAASAAANQPPVTYYDTLQVGICRNGYKDVVANDVDPEGNTPLTLVSITASNSGLGEASISSPTTIRYHAFGAPGGDQITYTVQDSLGAVSTEILDINIVDGTGCM